MKEKAGLRKEHQVIDELRRQGAVVVTSHAADHDGKIDWKIPEIKGYVLRRPSESQFTTNTEDDNKLRQFLKVLYRDEPTIFFYTQAERDDRITPAYIASCTIEKTLKLQDLLAKISIFVMHLDYTADGQQCRLMDFKTRLAEIAQKRQREEKLHRRTNGGVYLVGMDFVMVRESFTNRTFKAYWSDIRNGQILSHLHSLAMLEHSQNKRTVHLPQPVPVSFLVVDERAKQIQPPR